MRSVDVLREEHDAVLGVLGLLETAAEAAARGRPMPADVFSDVQEFITVFVDQCHHHKEEGAVFPRLEARPGGRALIARLEREHATGRHLAANYVAAVSQYVPGDQTSSGRLAEAARAYRAALAAHIDAETTELYPAMEAWLRDADGAMVLEFDRIEVEEIGAGTHERLHGMIDSLPGRIEARSVSATGA
ncbi:MAG TPA: hemerythrin domain-containing protein [Thermomicrobiaceae bacterium]|nr:hemerythrin domain-containing protein [Thermomicrobiaceae bacterium]